MSTYCCPRCRMEVERAARDCAACGKPIAPCTWSVRLSGVGSRAPDAQVVDYARCISPIRAGALALFWGVVVLMGAGGWWMVNGKDDALRELHQKVQEDVRGDAVPTRVRDDAMGLLEIQDGMVRIIKGACAALIVCGGIGVGAEVTSFRLTRRLLGTGSRAAE